MSKLRPYCALRAERRSSRKANMRVDDLIGEKEAVTGLAERFVVRVEEDAIYAKARE